MQVVGGQNYEEVTVVNLLDNRNSELKFQEIVGQIIQRTNLWLLVCVSYTYFYGDIKVQAKNETKTAYMQRFSFTFVSLSYYTNELY